MATYNEQNEEERQMTCDAFVEWIDASRKLFVRLDLDASDDDGIREAMIGLAGAGKLSHCERGGLAQLAAVIMFASNACNHIMGSICDEETHRKASS